MTIPAWPATLPQNLLVDGFQNSPPDLILRSSMEVGPAKQRRRATAGVRPVQGKIIVNETQLAEFIEFFDDDLLSGSLRFSWVDPLDGATAVEMRFTEVPPWTPVDPGIYEIVMSLEILP